MEAFITVFLFILGTAAVLGAAVGTWMWCDHFLSEQYEASRLFIILGIVGRALAGIAVVSAIIAIPISTGFFTTNNAAHCGEGTRYIEESHYNVALKQTVTEWQCIAV